MSDLFSSAAAFLLRSLLAGDKKKCFDTVHALCFYCVWSGVCVDGDEKISHLVVCKFRS